jgi:hypothetical protein
VLEFRSRETFLSFAQGQAGLFQRLAKVPVAFAGKAHPRNEGYVTKWYQDKINSNVVSRSDRFSM